MITQMNFMQFAHVYCERQEQTPECLKAILECQKERFAPDGWMMLECQQLDSSRLGSLTILPYGGKATHKVIPDHPVSPRGLASDMSVVIATMPAAEIP